MIASARLYEWAPSLVVAWRRLLGWVAARADVPLDVLDSSAVSLDALWAREDLGCVFMCGYPYALREPRPVLLAAPVPSPSRFGSRAVYVSDFIVRADAPARSLEETFGGRFAFSTEHSQSGYNGPRHHLARYGRSRLFGEVKGPYVRQRAVITAVVEGDADVAAIDGYAHELLRRHDAEMAARVRVVATTEPAPSPPLVASPTVPAPHRERLIDALLAVGEAVELKALREDLLLLGFARVDARDFDTLLAWRDDAAAAGYPTIR